MRYDTRLSRVLHALLHLDLMETPATSEVIAQMLQTNAAVVRRTMAGLREAGIVTSTKGHRGGWLLARPLTDISLMDIYLALGSPELFAIGKDEEKTSCLLARAADAATMAALASARLEFERALRAVSVADLTASGERISVAARQVD
ncbi:RrF2 family transcriptional regulator [Janthinobacterium sp. RB2R34]|uniref:RrF2 family transcriptional regulator n=1 Tax=Janthinobacterium sp. RB2R34 TaxID=3424193 RepID=UPI003F290F45